MKNAHKRNGYKCQKKYLSSNNDLWLSRGNSRIENEKAAAVNFSSPTSLTDPSLLNVTRRSRLIRGFLAFDVSARVLWWMHNECRRKWTLFRHMVPSNITRYRLKSFYCLCASEQLRTVLLFSVITFSKNVSRKSQFALCRQAGQLKGLLGSAWHRFCRSAGTTSSIPI